MDAEHVLAEVRSPLRSEPRFTRRDAVELAFDAGALVVEGEATGAR
jgi:hypothetical protein